MHYSHTKNLMLATLISASVMTGIIAAKAQVLGPPASATAPQMAPASPAFNPKAALEALQLRQTGEITRKKHHQETEAVMADGRRVIVSFDLSGRLWEVEHADHDKRRFGDGPINSGAAVEAARSAGFSNPAVREVKRNHTTVSAMTRNGEPVELQVDRSGTIYKQVWVR